MVVGVAVWTHLSNGYNYICGRGDFRPRRCDDVSPREEGDNGRNARCHIVNIYNNGALVNGARLLPFRFNFDPPGLQSTTMRRRDAAETH